MITYGFLKSSYVSALVKVSVRTHLLAFKEADADDTKQSLDSQRSKSPQIFVDLVIYAKFVIGRGHGDVVKKRHIGLVALSKRIHFLIALDVFCSKLTTIVMGISYISRS